MSETDDLLSKARALGEALAAHPHVREHYAAQRTAREDPTARKLLHDYQTHLEYLRQLEAEQRPIEVADKHRLRELETQLTGNVVLKELMRTQAEYVALMNRVNAAMDAPLRALAQPERPA